MCALRCSVLSHCAHALWSRLSAFSSVPLQLHSRSTFCTLDSLISHTVLSRCTLERLSVHSHCTLGFLYSRTVLSAFCTLDSMHSRFNVDSLYSQLFVPSHCTLNSVLSHCTRL